MFEVNATAVMWFLFGNICDIFQETQSANICGGSLISEGWDKMTDDGTARDYDRNGQVYSFTGHTN